MSSHTELARPELAEGRLGGFISLLPPKLSGWRPGIYRVNVITIIDFKEALCKVFKEAPCKEKSR
jgi:hypothetical protein